MTTKKTPTLVDTLKKQANYLGPGKTTQEENDRFFVENGKKSNWTNYQTFMHIIKDDDQKLPDRKGLAGNDIHNKTFYTLDMPNKIQQEMIQRFADKRVPLKAYGFLETSSGDKCGLFNIYAITKKDEIIYQASNKSLEKFQESMKKFNHHKFGLNIFKYKS